LEECTSVQCLGGTTTVVSSLLVGGIRKKIGKKLVKKSIKNTFSEK